MRSTHVRSARHVRSVVAVLAAFAFLIPAATPLAAQNRFILESSGVAAAQVATAPHGMVASQERRATEIGLDVLARGGNAVDAAVAVGFALAVTLPKAGNIGGGGFMVVHLADRHEDIAIDYREAAPAAARSDIFLGPEGQADPKKSRDTGLGVGVPGTVAGLSLALTHMAPASSALPISLRPRCGSPAPAFRSRTISSTCSFSRSRGSRNGRRRSRSF